MANVFENRVWVLDTEHNTKRLHGIDHDVTVKRVVWQPSAGAQSLILKNAGAQVKLSETSLAAAPAGEERYDFSGLEPEGGLVFHKGVILHTLTAGGTVYLYL